MATGTKRQASQAPKGKLKKLKITKSNTLRDEEVASSSDRDTRKVGDAEDYDIVMDDSELMIPRNTKIDEWVSIFRNIIETKEKQILAQLETRRTAIADEAATFHSRILPIFAQALLPLDTNEISSAPQTRPPAEDDQMLDIHFTSIQDQHLSDQVSDLFDNCKTLLDTYTHLLATESSSASPNPRISRLANLQSDLDKDKDATLAVLDAGKKVALADVERMLADRYHEIRGRNGLGREDEAKGRMLLAKGVDASHCGGDEKLVNAGRIHADDQTVLMGWGNVAFDVQEAVKRLDEVVGRE